MVRASAQTVAEEIPITRGVLRDTPEFLLQIAPGNHASSYGTQAPGKTNGLKGVNMLLST
ncbi:hypothetical protein A3D72_00250 [Candidatus Uhrbacteria bacterium RIFCSPHIGHO2_02_FULL_57_19]|uniref:Uncharacterized protein n=1 Tax=Candidatus Uhrbacteria bacterium RIFCSPHIGHO2_02_FULL_57_19 TaxID=1802391 RepID=A0A1F7U4F4_9BACT|nr:MAG: hypothetical protein A3D72_00250 [Candidatus Uhrbacteria bacterium RIFCSPHIGHO2_02_FULL_57_19]